MSQKSEILALLKRGETITPLEARLWLGCDRLASRIGELREDGYEIDNPLIRVGKGKYVSQYKLRGNRGTS